MGDYLLVQADHDNEETRTLSSELKARAQAQGLSISVLGPALWLGLGGPHRPRLSEFGHWRLIGDVIERRNPSLDALSDTDDYAGERELLRHVWGRFVGIRLDRGRLSHLLRDPSGALECLTWSQSDLTFVASDAPDWLVRTLRPGWTINVSRLDAALRDPVMASGPLLLNGPVAVAPGAVQPMPTHRGEAVALWRPVDVAHRSLGSAPDLQTAARSIRAAVCEAVEGLGRLCQPIAAEVSGGLDSSVVAACLTQADIDVRLWLNAYGATAEADERAYLATLARQLDIQPQSVPHATSPLSEDILEAISQGLRPGLAALDPHHDLDWAERISAAGAVAVLTGKGGDSIFVQATEDVFADLWASRGWLSFCHPDAVRLAAATEKSVWSLAQGARRRLRADPSPPLRDEGLLAPTSSQRETHPWLIGTEIFGPAKRLQIVGVANVVARHGPSLLTQTIDVRHPLCSQPVLEACLALPAPLLTTGGRDRGLARLAFKDRLPSEIFGRRTKGNMTRIYARMIFENLDVLRPWLIEGRLAALGVIDPVAADRRLTRENLIWHGRYSAIIVAAAFEGWVRVWERRLSARE